MDEFSVAEVEAAMGSACLIGGEEDKIPRNQLAAALGALAQEVLVVCQTGDGDAVPGEDVLKIAGTVKTAWCGAAEGIGRADVFLCRCDEGIDVLLFQDQGVVRHCLPLGGNRIHACRGRLCLVCAPFPILGVLEGAPGGTGHDACGLEFVVPLEFRHGPFRFCTEDTVDLSYGIADVLEFLLEQEHIVSMGVTFQGWRGKSGGREQEQCKVYSDA